MVRIWMLCTSLASKDFYEKLSSIFYLLLLLSFFFVFFLIKFLFKIFFITLMMELQFSSRVVARFIVFHDTKGINVAHIMVLVGLPTLIKNVTFSFFFLLFCTS